MSKPIIINRPGATYARTGINKTKLNELIVCGLFPPAISQGGGRAVGFIESEVDAVMLARASGLSEKEIKSLVIKLVEHRAQRLDEMLLEICA